MPPLTIKRDELIRIAKKSMTSSVPPALRRDLLRVAKTAPYITAEWRSEDDSCGCLIGEFYGEDLELLELLDVEHTIGMEFGRLLSAALGEHDHIINEPVKVID